MSSEWKEYKFSDFVSINPQVKMKSGEIYSYVEMKDLQDGQKFCFPSIERELKGGSKFQNGDTLFARITPCLENGKICQVKGLKNNTGFGSTEFLVFRGEEYVSDTDFIYYLARWDEVRSFAESNLEGTSGRQRVPKEVFDNFNLLLPNLAEQKSITEVLSSLDDKIDLLDRQNKTLERLAETLFRQWFVEEMEEDWKVGTIGNFAKSIQYGFTQSASLINIGPKFLRITDIQGGKVNWESVPFCTLNESDFMKYELHSGDIVVARTGASTGENIYLYEPEKAIFASYLIRIQFLKHSFARFVALHMRSTDYFRYIEGILSGSAQPNANANELTSFEIAVPSEEKLESFFKIITEFDKKKHFNEIQIRTLSKFRDTLLPKLMSGEVRLKTS